MSEQKNDPLTPAEALRLFPSTTCITRDNDGRVDWWRRRPTLINGRWRLEYSMSRCYLSQTNIAWPDGCNIWPMDETEVSE